MSDLSKDKEEALLRLILNGAETVSSTPEKARQYMKEMGYDPEKIRKELLQKINLKIKEIQAKKIKEAQEKLKPWKGWGRGGDQGMER